MKMGTITEADASKLDQIKWDERPKASNGSEHRIPVRFRWPVRQIKGDMVEVIIPMGNGAPPVLHQSFVEIHKLSDAEVERAEQTVLRQIVVLPD